MTQKPQECKHVKQLAASRLGPRGGASQERATVCVRARVCACDSSCDMRCAREETASQCILKTCFFSDGEREEEAAGLCSGAEARSETAHKRFPFFVQFFFVVVVERP